jgi:hypothetical protein
MSDLALADPVDTSLVPGIIKAIEANTFIDPTVAVTSAQVQDIMDYCSDVFVYLDYNGHVLFQEDFIEWILKCKVKVEFPSYTRGIVVYMVLTYLSEIYVAYNQYLRFKLKTLVEEGFKLLPGLDENFASKLMQKSFAMLKAHNMKISVHVE